VHPAAAAPPPAPPEGPATADDDAGAAGDQGAAAPAAWLAAAGADEGAAPQGPAADAAAAAAASAGTGSYRLLPADMGLQYPLTQLQGSDTPDQQAAPWPGVPQQAAVDPLYSSAVGSLGATPAPPAAAEAPLMGPSGSPAAEGGLSMQQVASGSAELLSLPTEQLLQLLDNDIEWDPDDLFADPVSPGSDLGLQGSGLQGLGRDDAGLQGSGLQGIGLEGVGGSGQSAALPSLQLDPLGLGSPLDQLTTTLSQPPAPIAQQQQEGEMEEDILAGFDCDNASLDELLQFIWEDDNAAADPGHSPARDNLSPAAAATTCKAAAGAAAAVGFGGSEGPGGSDRSSTAAGAGAAAADGEVGVSRRSGLAASRAVAAAAPAAEKTHGQQDSSSGIPGAAGHTSSLSATRATVASYSGGLNSTADFSSSSSSSSKTGGDVQCSVVEISSTDGSQQSLQADSNMPDGITYIDYIVAKLLPTPLLTPQLTPLVGVQQLQPSYHRAWSGKADQTPLSDGSRPPLLHHHSSKTSCSSSMRANLPARLEQVSIAGTDSVGNLPRALSLGSSSAAAAALAAAGDDDDHGVGSPCSADRVCLEARLLWDMDSAADVSSAAAGMLSALAHSGMPGPASPAPSDAVYSAAASSAPPSDTPAEAVLLLLLVTWLITCHTAGCCLLQLRVMLHAVWQLQVMRAAAAREAAICSGSCLLQLRVMLQAVLQLQVMRAAAAAAAAREAARCSGAPQLLSRLATKELPLLSSGQGRDWGGVSFTVGNAICLLRMFHLAV